MRILRLPLLCIVEILENWNLFQLYLFSLLSRRARVITKLKKFATPEKAIISTYEGFELILIYSEGVQWNFTFTGEERLSQNHLNDPCRKQLNGSKTRTLFFRNPVQDGLQFGDFLIYLFNVSVAEITLYIGKGNNPNDLECTIEWINNQKNLEIPKSTIFAQTNDLLALTVQKYRKKTKAFHIWAAFVNEKPDPAVIFSPSLQLDELYVHPLSNNVYGMSLDFMLSSNFPRIEMSGKSMTCQDINTFLKSWKNGKTNSELKVCGLKMSCHIDMKTISKGLEPVIHDLKTKETVDKHRDLICYRMEIERLDGKRAKFYVELYWLEEGEDVELHQEVVDEYHDTKESKEDEEGKLEIGQNREWCFWIEIE